MSIILLETLQPTSRTDVICHFIQNENILLLLPHYVHHHPLTIIGTDDHLDLHLDLHLDKEFDNMVSGYHRRRGLELVCCGFSQITVCSNKEGMQTLELTLLNRKVTSFIYF